MERQTLLDAIPHCLTATDLPLAAKYPGKVRDTYEIGDGRLLLVTTDRQSGFDRLLGAIPFKGQVLNRTSLYWFEQTRGIIGNHVLFSPHANALVGRKCQVLPIEFVVRGYLTGSTDTSIWTQYQSGARTYCGHALPDGMKKNEPLPENIVTPTTKEKTHDRPITAREIVAEGWMTAEQWELTSSKALELFAFGQKLAAERGLILADTKYEFGVASDGEVLLIDEIHTPDSSRYWLADSYAERLSGGQEPNRLWFRDRCDPYKDAVLPVPPDDLIAELASRYIQLFEKITGMSFVPDLRPLEATVLAGLER
jgi:phosphoribosylaminoimidazole-succinocarboxamide synthase